MCVSYCRHLYCHHKYLHRHIHSSPKYHHNLGNPSHHRFYHSLAASGCGRVSGPIQHQQSIASLANISSGDGDEDDIRSWRQLIFWRLTVWGGFFPGPAVTCCCTDPTLRDIVPHLLSQTSINYNQYDIAFQSPHDGSPVNQLWKF